MTGGHAGARRYDRSRGSRAPRLPAVPFAVRSRNDAIRDYDRLAAAFARLLVEALPPPPPSQPGSRSPNTPRRECDSIDEAIAAANALSETLCEWREVGFADTSSSTAAAATTAAPDKDSDNNNNDDSAPPSWVVMSS